MLEQLYNDFTSGINNLPFTSLNSTDVKSTIFLAFFIATSFALFAQTDKPSEGKWELGVDFLPYIDTTYTVRNSILIRLKLGDKAKFRSRVGISFQEIRNRPYTLVPNKDLLSGSPFQGYLSLGIENYLKEGRVSIFIGGDIFGTYYRRLEQSELDTRPLANPPTIYKIKDLYHEYKLGLNILSGVNVRLLPHLYISTEAFLQTAYRWQKEDYRQYEGEDLVLTVSGGRVIKRLIVDLQPISAIHLIYQF